MSGVGRGSLRRETGGQEVRRKIFFEAFWWPDLKSCAVAYRLTLPRMQSEDWKPTEASGFSTARFLRCRSDMLEVPASVLDTLKEQVIGCAINVHRAFGPGLLESIYHLAQVITYLKLTGLPEGLLMNFNTTALRAGLRSVVHPDLYRARLLSGRQ